MSAAAQHPSSPATTTSLRWPPRPALAVAFVYLRAQAGGDFFSDVPFAWSAGELRRDGITADLFELRYERGEPAYNRALDADLLARLAAGGYDLVIVESCWQAELIDAIREQGAWLCETAPAAVHPGHHVDFVLRHYTRDRQPLRALVARLRDGEDLHGLTNVRAWSAAAGRLIALGADRPIPEHPAAQLAFCPITDATRIGVAMDLRGAPPPVRRSLDTNDGCPFSKPVTENAAFAGVDLSAPDITMAGCSFCFMGGDYRALPWRETVAVHLDQIATWQRSPAGLDEVVLRDQHAIRYLPALLRAAIAAGLPPVGVLVPGRGDAILRYADTLAEAAAVAANTGFWFALYLVGFESFSEPQLLRYNKGVTPAAYGVALAQLRALHRRSPDSFRLYAYGSSSFILWEPWATLDDLTANVTFIEQHAVARLSRGLATTRLRLYPNLPLYWRAKRDGLLLDGAAADDRGAAQTGYAEEARWQTADGRVAAVEELVRRLLREARAEAQVGVLKAATAWARRRWPAPLPPADAAALSPRAPPLATDDGQATPDDTRRRHDELRDAVSAAEAGWQLVRRRYRPAPAGAPSEQPAPRLPTSWSDQAASWRAARQDAAAIVTRRARQTVQLGATCNNRCATCVGRHDQREADLTRLLHTVVQAANPGEKLTLTGREPTLLPGLLQLSRAARRAGASGVEIVTNGRALATPGAAAKLARHGVTELLLKRHRLADDDEDVYVRAPGAGAQLNRGIEHANAAGLRWRALFIPTADAPGELAALVRWAQAAGATGVQVEVRIDEVVFEAAERWATALDAARAEASRLAIPIAIDGD